MFNKTYCLAELVLVLTEKQNERLTQFVREASERYLTTTLKAKQTELGNKVGHRISCIV